MSDHIPALRFHSLTRLYDRIVRVAMRDHHFRRVFVDLLRLPVGSRVLDLGCGTGSTTVLVKQRFPEAAVTGIDADTEALEIAASKAAVRGLDIKWSVASATELPFSGGSFDVIVSTLMFHHLAAFDKARALFECHRVLVPFGRLYVLDWGKPSNFFLRTSFTLVQLLDGFENTRDHVDGGFFELFSVAGFEHFVMHDPVNTAFGTLEIASAIR